MFRKTPQHFVEINMKPSNLASTMVNINIKQPWEYMKKVIIKKFNYSEW